jgi:hypothetical protein
MLPMLILILMYLFWPIVIGVVIGLIARRSAEWQGLAFIGIAFVSVVRAGYRFFGGGMMRSLDIFQLVDPILSGALTIVVCAMVGGARYGRSAPGAESAADSYPREEVVDASGFPLPQAWQKNKR